MEIDITFLLSENEYDLMDYSASAMELGNDAGSITWNNSKESGIVFVSTPEEIQEAQDYIQGFGSWSETEIKAWSLTELNALILQLIAGDLREYLDAINNGPEALEYYRANYGGIIGEGIDGKLYYTLGN